MPDIKTVTMLEAREVKAECPHCREMNDGFVGDPRGGKFDCEFCGNKFKIHPEADIEMF